MGLTLSSTTLSCRTSGCRCAGRCGRLSRSRCSQCAGALYRWSKSLCCRWSGASSRCHTCAYCQSAATSSVAPPVGRAAGPSSCRTADSQCLGQCPRCRRRSSFLCAGRTFERWPRQVSRAGPLRELGHKGGALFSW
jgi:hypothetical protein